MDQKLIIQIGGNQCYYIYIYIQMEIHFEKNVNDML